MTALAIVGDVHGAIRPLRQAISWLDKNWAHNVVFVGDYVNRGTESYLVVEELVDLTKRWGSRLSLLLGNHELSLLEFLDGGSPESFLHHGGLQTINNYLRACGGVPEARPLEAFRDRFPHHHRQLLANMALAYETDEVLVTHAGFNPKNPASRGSRDIVFGRHSELFMNPETFPRPLVVCGHYVQRSATPYVTENFICLDTGCGTIPGAPLAVAILPSREILTFYGEQ